MQDILKSDIFFFTATLATIVITVFVVIAFVYLVKLLRKANRIGEKVESGVEAVENGIKSQSWLSFLFKKSKKKSEKR